ncbi:MAG: hypothetical protein KBB14_07560 [Thermoanaerobaculia bacterium]|nr:hypothetical protein [Thermoanaerobaculia bacterium]
MNIVSVDLGMGPDPTSLVVLEGRTWGYLETRQIEESRVTTWQPIFRRPDGRESYDCPPPVFHLRYLERTPPGCSYAKLVQRVKSIQKGLREPTLAIDATGVGQAAVELFRQEELNPWVVTITAGDEAAEAGMNARVPKRDVISTAQVLLQTGRLKIARDLPTAQLLLRELQGFRMNVDLKRTNESLVWREGANDDLVLALCVGLWIGERHPGIPSSMSLVKPACPRRVI